ncbi:MAG: hypothetical protein JWN51_1761 [Phycisphaerales bacterium]|nr:hypothetical protein [Phycisphaerales bacterium]
MNTGSDQSNQRTGARSTIAGIAALAMLFVFAPALRAAPEAVSPGTGLHMDPAKVVGSGKCAECHKAEDNAWQHTHHFATFTALPKEKRAKEIADAMGLEGGIRRNGTCLNCHFTVQNKEGAATPVAGVSCESCHGAAKDWLTLHNDYGQGKTRETESADHKKKRHDDADATGMIRKDRVSLIAANCYSCHTVPNQDLVNKGGHKAGSDLELVAWSQGEVRHNYLVNQAKNAVETPQRKRVLYVVGQATDLEFSLRGAQKITEKGAYRDAMLARVRNATTKLDEVLKKVKIAEYDQVLAGIPRAENGQLKLSKDLLAALPDKLAAASQAFVASNDGAALDGVDELLPKDAKGSAQP